MRHPPAIPMEQFAHLKPEARAHAQEQYAAKFERGQRDLGRMELHRALETLPVIDIMMIRSAYQKGDDAEIGRIFANAITNVVSADAVVFASRQRAMHATEDDSDEALPAAA